MEISEAIRTNGAVRAFTDEPVDDETVAAILDDARFAPSGGNRQGWRVAVVGDRGIRRRMAELMQPVWDEYVAIGATGATPFNVIGQPAIEVAKPSPNPLLEAFGSVPVVLAIAADLSMVAMMDKDLDRPALTGGASIYPFCWSILLAARSRGLGGVLTTFLSRAEPEAGPLLGLPDGHALAATICLGHPIHQPTRLSRRPVGAFATVDRFDGTPFGGTADGAKLPA